jgi:hypothetical protein
LSDMDSRIIKQYRWRNRTETITHAYFFLIRERMVREDASDWDEFAANNPDLLVWEGGVLGRYYRESTLQSELARRVFLFPDRCA